MLLFQMSVKPFYANFYAHYFSLYIKCINLYDIVMYVDQEKQFPCKQLTWI